MSANSECRLSAIHSLPSGWKKEEMCRKSGLSIGKVNIYYLSPDGRRARSKLQLSKLLGENYDLSNFDFKSGIFNPNSSHKYTFPIQANSSSDISTVTPIRQTASIFKQPVTIYRNHNDSKLRTDLKHGIKDGPKQLIWMKRLEGLTPRNPNNDDYDNDINSIKLPSSLQGTSYGIIGTLGILQSIATALHISNQPVSGQTIDKNLLNKYSTININADQPLIQNSIITDADINQQQSKVIEVRNQLAQAITNYNQQDCIYLDPLSEDI